MSLQAAVHSAIAPLHAALDNAILFVDEPTSLILSSIESAPAAASAVPLRGVDYLVDRMGVRNVIAIDDTIASVDNEGALGTALGTAVAVAPTTVAPAAKSTSAEDAGWNNDLDFPDVDDAEAADEQKSTGAAVAASHTAPIASRCITILPLDLSHASIDDPDVLALIDSATEEATAAAAAAAPAAASKPAKADEWGWNDDADEADAAEEKAAAPVKLSAAKRGHARSTKPGPPVRATSKACVWISGALSSAVLTRVAKLVAHTRCGPAAFTAPGSSPELQAWDHVHVFTSASENAHVEDRLIGHSFAALEAQLVSLVQAQRKTMGEPFLASASKLKVRIHFAPLAVAPLSVSTFLVPAALPATDVTAARVATVPPALHMPSDASLASLLASAASVVGATTAPAPTTASTSAPSSSSSAPASSPSSSASSLLGGFSVSNALSNISKGLSDHIREAEAIAMQGADPNAKAATTGSGGAAAATVTASSPSSLSTPLSCSLANLLLTLRIQPDFFALGPSTSELASLTLSQMRSLKQQSLVAETLAIEEAEEALRLHKRKHGQRSGAPPAPVIPAALPPWTTGSVLLVDRSLDLLSVAMHHSPAESMRDRLHDASESNEEIAEEESKQSPALTQEEMIQQMLVTEVDPSATPDFKSLPVDADAVRDAWFGSSDAAELGARHPRHANFPVAPASAEARSLLHALDGLSSSSEAAAALASSSAAVKAVLTLLRKHLSKLLSNYGLAAEAAGAGAGSTSVTQLAQECWRLLETVEQHPELRFRHRELLQLCKAILRSCGRSSSSTTSPSLYDRLRNFEQLLMVQLLSHASTAAGSASNNSSEDESTRVMRGLTQLVLDFIRDASEPTGDGADRQASSAADSKRTTKAHGAKESGAAAAARGVRISIQDTLRLLLFFFSLTGGKYLVPEAESAQLESALRSVMRSAPALQRRWLAQVGGLDSESALTEEITAKILSGFFEQLRAVSVARNGLSAADLIDLFSPLESALGDSSDASAHEGGGFQPFLVRLLSRVFDPSALVDDLESMPFGEDDTTDAAATKSNEEDSDNASGVGGNRSKQAQKDRASSLGTDSSAATSVAAPSSASGWSFLGSLASSVVSSVTSTASSLGFRHSTLRPGMAAGPLLIFIVGGATYGEMRRLQRMAEVWAKRVHAEEASATREDNKPTPALRTVSVGATHISTAQETVEALLRSAAKDIRGEAAQMFSPRSRE